MEKIIKPPRNFCATPWLESVLYADGAFRPCSRNNRIFGDWHKDDVKSIWNNETFREFRQKIHEGEYPDEYCKACHLSGTAQNMYRILNTVAVDSVRVAESASGVVSKELRGIFPVLTATERSSDTDKALGAFLGAVERIEQTGANTPERRNEFAHAVRKLKNVGLILKAFLNGEESDSPVAPFRQVQLIARCNARCQMCPGKYSGEIVDGPVMDEKYVEQALAEPHDIVDFFTNGSEFLFFRGWREVSRILRDQSGVNVRISTNGMLLTKDNVDYLLDNRLFCHLNISVNGFKKETVEFVQGQGRVKYDRLMANIDYLLDRASKLPDDFVISFSFVLSKTNYRELPDFVRWVAGLRKKWNKRGMHVMLMGMENAEHPGYREYLYKDHPELIPHKDLFQVFKAALYESIQGEVQVMMYNFGPSTTLRKFMSEGFEVPGFIPCRIDLEIMDEKFQGWLKYASATMQEAVRREVEILVSPFFTHKLRRSPLRRQDFLDRVFERLTKALPAMIRELEEAAYQQVCAKVGVNDAIQERIGELFQLREKAEEYVAREFNDVTYWLHAATGYYDATVSTVLADNGKRLRISRGAHFLRLRDNILDRDGRTLVFLGRLGDHAFVTGNYASVWLIPETSIRGLILRVEPPALYRVLHLYMAVGFFRAVFWLKSRVIGNRKSLWLWRASRVYRRIMRLLGVKFADEAAPILV